MSEPSKTGEGKNYPVRWEGVDWDRIVLVAKEMSAQEHLDLTPADVIRKAVRILCEERLGPIPADSAAQSA